MSIKVVIGDIHGCYYTLKNLVKKVEKKFGDVSWFCTGDLVDRGKHSLQTVDYVINKGIKPVLGNHDYMFHTVMTDKTHPMTKTWFYNGAASTIKSYDGKQSVLDEHLEFFGSLSLFYRTEEFLLSHAGISERLCSMGGLSTTEIDEENLTKLAVNHLSDPFGILWNRERLCKFIFPQIVGHTGMHKVLFDNSTNSVYCDTYAVRGNALSAVIVSHEKGMEVFAEETHKKDRI